MATTKGYKNDCTINIRTSPGSNNWSIAVLFYKTANLLSIKVGCALVFRVLMLAICVNVLKGK